MSDYEFDVFISYENDHEVTRWIVEEFLRVFAPILRAEIAMACNRPPTKIFFAFNEAQFPNRPPHVKLHVAGVPPGAVWEDSLRNAIRSSRCMVGLWNPTYFYSDWCNVEWRSFHKRAQDTSKDIVLGASCYDGESFPPEAKARQIVELSLFYLFFGGALENNQRYAEFMTALKSLAKGVALAVRDAPPFQNWPVVDDTPTVPQRAIPLTRM